MYSIRIWFIGNVFYSIVSVKDCMSKIARILPLSGADRRVAALFAGLALFLALAISCGEAHGGDRSAGGDAGRQITGLAGSPPAEALLSGTTVEPVLGCGGGMRCQLRKTFAALLSASVKPCLPGISASARLVDDDPAFIYSSLSRRSLPVRAGPLS